MVVSFGQAFSRQHWLALALTWAVTSAVLVVRIYALDPPTLFFGDTDDAMRLVVVRDLLAGQNWFDLVNHRLNTPFGAEVHWSRFVDVPLALLLALTSAIFGADTGLIITAIVWPLLLLAVLLYLSARIAQEILGPDGVLPALILPVLNSALIAEFSPARMDHHNVVLLLVLAMLLSALVSLRRPIGAWLAGGFAGLAMGVAVEAAPLVIGAILAFGFTYVLSADRKHNLGWFGIGFSAVSCLSLALTRLPERWFEAACDMISPVYVLAALLVSAVFIALALVPAFRSPWQRFAVLAFFGATAGGIVMATYPECVAGPYAALDPWLKTNWLANIVEAHPWHVSLTERPGYAVAVGIPVLLALVVGGVAISKAPRKEPWVILLCFLALATLAMLAQVRGARLATMLAVPFGAWMILQARAAYLNRKSLGSAVVMLGSWLVFAGAPLTVLVTMALNYWTPETVVADMERGTSKTACLLPEAFTDLAALPPERVMSFIDLGSHLLLYTPHAVVSAPYHRNEQGVLDTFRFFTRSAEEAEAMARKRGLGLVVLCPAMPEMRGNGLETPGTLLHHFANNTLPKWLVEVTVAPPLRVFAVML